MDDETFELFTKYIMVRMRGLKLPEEKILDLIKLDWNVFSDVPAMQGVVDSFELAQTKTILDNNDLRRPSLVARIAELEAKEG